MFENHYLFINLICCCLLLVSSSLNVSNISRSRVCLPKQSSALLKLKEEFAFERSICDYDKSSYPRMKYWNAETDCCIWDGITSDMETGNVIGINLSNSCLKGPLRSNSSLFNFLHIQLLNLAFNNFTLSSIPKELAQLSRLTHLNFSSSSFTGYISSEISWLTKLVSLDLSYNTVTLRKGDMTRLIKNMTNLRQLHLDRVNIFSSIPISLGNLSSLTSLSLWNCDLLGEFPNNIFQLSKIEAIDVSGNYNLGGLLPEFNSSNKLKSLKLYFTNFSGRLPESIGNLKSLNVLDLTNCNFLGNVPSSLGNLSQLSSLGLSSNRFNSQISSILKNLAMLKNLEELGLSYFLNSQHSSSLVLRELKNLTRLKSLDLSNNFLTGQFPMVLANFTQLSSLYLSNNQLTGPISSCINIILNSIKFLYLYNNSFTGVIPSSLFMISSLERLYLSSNKFMGSLHLQNISSFQLKYLSLSENKLTGPFPTSLFRLTNLTSLSLGSNGFNGTIEFENFSELSLLQALSLSDNNLSVKFTNNTSTLPKFDYLDLSSCNINGNFPNFLRSQDELGLLDLSNNKLEGKIPKWFWSIGTKTLYRLNLSHNFISGFEQAPLNFTWRQIYYLDMRSNTLQDSLLVPPLSTMYYFISTNNLTGKIHPSFCKLSNLVVLDVSNNSLSGSLPDCLENLSSSLEVLQLKGNNFEGEIPQISTINCNMKTLDVSHNKLQGEIPESLNRCGGLEVLNLGHNQLNDTFPFWLQNLPELKVLVLRSNKFHGPIWNPHHFFGFVKLKIIDLSFNNFNGTLPADYFKNWTSMTLDEDKSGLRYMGNELNYYQDSLTLMNKGLEMELVKIITTFTSIDLSNNNFHGELPKSMADLQSLVVLNLSSNNFNDLIPPSLSNLTNLQSLDLSRNNFSGRIPPQLTALTFLEYLNFSQNNLTGPIPNERQFSTFTNSSFEGNPGLCGPPLSNTCEKQDTPTSYQSEEHEGSNYFDWKISLIGYGSGLVIGICIGHVFITPRWIYWFLRVLRRNLCW